MDDLPPSGPARDRYLARQVRHGPRFAKEAGRLVETWWRGPDGQRIRRNRRLAGAMKHALSDAELEKVEPVTIKQGGDQPGRILALSLWTQSEAP